VVRPGPPSLIEDRETKSEGRVAIDYRIMKTHAFIPLAVAFLMGTPLLARESVKSLAELEALQKMVKEVSSKVLPATVALVSAETGSSGSGVVTTADGLILTAAHVIQGADELEVVFPSGRKVTGKVLGANLSKDIGMVKITESGEWPFIARGESKPLEAGDWVVALGHSAGFDPGRTPPVRFGRVVSKGPGNFFTTDCTLIGGDSGGPIFNLEGKIIGVNSSIGMSLKNNNHAGVDGFKDDWDRLLAGDMWGRLSMNPFANPEMPVLGIVMGDERLTDGVTVAGFYRLSPAAAAGVKAGDKLVSIDSTELSSRRDLSIYLAKKQPGDKVKLGILRDRTKQEITVTLSRYDTVFKER
jgi:serine protease Do